MDNCNMIYSHVQYIFFSEVQHIGPAKGNLSHCSLLQKLWIMLKIQYMLGYIFYNALSVVILICFIHTLEYGAFSPHYL